MQLADGRRARFRVADVHDPPARQGLVVGDAPLDVQPPALRQYARGFSEFVDRIVWPEPQEVPVHLGRCGRKRFKRRFLRKLHGREPREIKQ